MKMKKLVALLLAVCLIGSLAACAPADDDNSTTATVYVDPYKDIYDEMSTAVYEEVPW